METVSALAREGALLKEGVFEVKAIHIEPGVRASDEMMSDVATTIRECAVWHKTPEVLVRWSGQPAVAGRLRKAVER